MATYALRRILQTIPILFIISVLLFLLVRAAPGGPLTAARRNPNISKEQIEAIEEKLGLNDPLPVQYGRWLGGLLSGDMGDSIKFRRPVSEMIGERIPNTLTLVGASFFVTLLLAIPVGIFSARKPYSPFDYTMTTVTFIGQAIPVYWLGLGLIVVFYVVLKNPFTGDPLFPVGGMNTRGQEGNWLDTLWHLVLPVAALSLGWIAWYSRFLRSSMMDVLHEDYVRTAKAKGLSERVVHYKHALQNAILPLITLIALDLPSLFAGALFVETIFSWPGMGRLFWDAAKGRDYPVLLGVVMITATLIIVCNILADLAYGWLDPRVKYD
ncbi:MAG: ABC transporter permease [Chloroflexi bacterium CFX1]|nr:ABC transporter permease [Chloroflexi bacterium CFX1]MCQ3953691.1 diguanylate cyclase [Chloroflexota bacterium]MDL1920120.1 ABC transporter permease [Chloroflexi bacterium CFX5]NUQ59388.1 ABC transporter permease [Anaerolineales bacterium]